MNAVEQTRSPAWQSDARLLPVVNLLKRHWPQNVQAAVDRTECFGLFVIAAEGKCEQAGQCELASYCERAYETACVQSAQAATTPIRLIDSADEDEGAKPLFTPHKVRNKWRGTEKYLRAGYEPCGRHVDTLLAAFWTEMPALPKLPLIWNAQNFDGKFSRLGHFLTSATASYTTVLRDGTVLCRFWTNTVKQAIVDILPELETRIRKESERLGVYRYKQRELPQLEAPHAVPKASWLKLRPCTHRVIVRTPDAAKAVAKAVREQWRIRARS